jgi:hypothetical protein
MRGVPSERSAGVPSALSRGTSTRSTTVVLSTV